MRKSAVQPAPFFGRWLFLLARLCYDFATPDFYMKDAYDEADCAL
jgi:hypothetical protein